jgi:hypothetical protein
MEKYKLYIVDESLAEALVERGYKLEDGGLMVDIEELGGVLDIIGEEDELEFEDNED